jgi:hypothetical protein
MGGFYTFPRPCANGWKRQRWGDVVIAVFAEAAGLDLTFTEVQRRVGSLLGELVAASSVKNSLARRVGGIEALFESTGHGRYRLRIEPAADSTQSSPNGGPPEVLSRYR